MKELRILVVDDHAYERKSICALLEGEGYAVEGAASGEEALEQIKRKERDLIITDLRMPGVSGTEVTRRVKTISPQTEVIVVTAYGEIATAVESMRRGALDYIMKGAKFPEALLESVGQAHRRIEARSGSASYEKIEIIGESLLMKEAKRNAGRYAQSDHPKCPVLILGESGTGKELFAKMIHQQSPRREKPFVVINCAAIPDGLADAELFGIDDGVATGVKKRIGRLKQADEGTLFLDEVGELKPDVQAKLLRAIDSGEIEPVGAREPIKVNVRIIAATNADLKREIREERFKEAFFHRLNALEIQLAPLRNRKEEIEPLVFHFLRMYGGPSRRISEGTLARLIAYDWPGNVRELEKVIQRAIILSDDETISEAYLPEEIRKPSKPENPLKERSLKEVERERIIQALRRHQGNISAAAEELGITRPTLYSKMKQHGINLEEILQEISDGK